MTKNELNHSDMVVELSDKSDDELKALLDELCEEEEWLSFKRRILHGKIDILRAELVERLKYKREKGESIISSADIERLTEILAKGVSGVSRADIAEENG